MGQKPPPARINDAIKKWQAAYGQILAKASDDAPVGERLKTVSHALSFVQGMIGALAMGLNIANRALAEEGRQDTLEQIALALETAMEKRS